MTSEIARTFDVLGFFAPSTIKVKILLQRIWEGGIGWDESVPPDIHHTYQKWRVELSILSNEVIPHCYFPCRSRDCQIQLHGFSDASEEAYASVLYLRIRAPDDSIHVSLVMSKTRVAPLKRLSIPRLELCGALLLSKILSHVQQTLEFSSCEVYAWTDSTVVLGWLNGDPRRFKTFVGNRVSQIVSLVAPGRWSHVTGSENLADCASRGLFPSELIDHDLWWTGPAWLHQDPSHWPSHTHRPDSNTSSEEAEQEFVCLASTDQPAGLIDFKWYSEYNYLKRVIAWMVHFINNCKPGSTQDRGSLTKQFKIENPRASRFYSSQPDMAIYHLSKHCAAIIVDGTDAEPCVTVTVAATESKRQPNRDSVGQLLAGMEKVAGDFTQELRKAELYMWLQAQSDDFLPEKRALQSGSSLS